jgi:hypothetical protein
MSEERCARCGHRKSYWAHGRADFVYNSKTGMTGHDFVPSRPSEGKKG